MVWFFFLFVLYPVGRARTWLCSIQPIPSSPCHWHGTTPLIPQTDLLGGQKVSNYLWKYSLHQESINKSCECPLLVALQKHLPIIPLALPCLQEGGPAAHCLLWPGSSSRRRSDALLWKLWEMWMHTELVWPWTHPEDAQWGWIQAGFPKKGVSGE